MKSQLAALYVTLGSDDVDVDEAAAALVLSARNGRSKSIFDCRNLDQAYKTTCDNNASWTVVSGPSADRSEEVA